MNIVYACKGNSFTATRDGKTIGFAHYNAKGNYIDTLFVSADVRRQGIGTALVQYVIATVGRKLNRCPDALKNDAIRSLGAKFGDAIGPEAKR
jgi:GNAT superfamily N-acetyltransferase